MTIVTEYDWESDTYTHHPDHGARQAWRAAVAEIAERAKATLPEANGRVDKAVAIVLNGDVELLPDGKPVWRPRPMAPWSTWSATAPVSAWTSPKLLAGGASTGLPLACRSGPLH